MQIQQQLGGIPPKQLVHALDNGGYPMGEEELRFQLELFQPS